MEKLKITLVQSKLFWEDVAKNLTHFSELLKTLKRGSTDLIVLPEMFTTGFSMNAKQFAEDKNGSAMQWMQKTAHEKNAVICGTLMFTEKGNYYNRLIWMRPDGTFEYYNKRHLFSLSHENEIYKRGLKKLFVELKGFKICPLVCYDLRFPVWSKNKTKIQKGNLIADYDVLLYVANWPKRRREAWKQLLPARAIENVSYVVGLNRVGKDGNGFLHTGDSGVFDFIGNKISKIKPSVQTIETITISKPELQKFRNDFQVLADADTFSIR